MVRKMMIPFAIGLGIIVGVIAGIQLDLIGWWEYRGLGVAWKGSESGVVSKHNKLSGHTYILVPKDVAQELYGRSKPFWRRIDVP